MKEFEESKNWATLSDEEVVRRVCAGEISLFELLLRRYNQRVYRVSRAVLHDDAEAEEVAQEIWVRIYTHLSQFARRSRFSTWLTRIAYNQAWAHAKRRKRSQSLEAKALRERQNTRASVSRDPEHEVSRRELRSVLERVVDTLPLAYRTVFMLREVEEMSTDETAAALQLTRSAVKVRLHRARALLRRELRDQVGGPFPEAFLFLGNRCDGLVHAVGAGIQEQSSPRRLKLS
ncbi:MAG: RNA polymerase sigma factor [Thermoanaerobaculia bacterium]|nr:RNA polymerase sigma factor [Thermoanaerobaculia bacterium]